MNFIRVAAACPVTNVADIDANLKNIKNCVEKALTKGAKFIVFPELSITSYSCGDLFRIENVRFGSLADILTRPRHVRFTPRRRIQVSIWLSVYEYTP
jgi:predicted amidohydrolase